MSRYVIAVDQGTTSSRALLIDHQGSIIDSAQEEFTQIYPQQGWVEHDPREIWEGQSRMIRKVLEQMDLSASDIAALGITNQRETTLVWDAATGEPVFNAIVWQCRRTAPLVEELKSRDLAEKFRLKTGLVLDAYFSGTKIRWILDNVPGARERAEKGELRFGTVDSWLIWQMTGGRVHVTDYTNASRTLLFNIHDLRWDEELLDILDIPASLLPEVKPSSTVYGHTEESLLGAPVPIAGIAGDQQAALFGQMCLEEGMVKNTYGTGGFMLMTTGDRPVESREGLLTTIAWGLNGGVTYALEGSIFMAGAIMQWLRDNLGIITDSAESGKLASSVEDNAGVYLVPAFQGMGTPYWSMDARAIITGLSRAARREHIVRAAEEAIAYRVRDVLEVMEKDSGLKVKDLKVDGGAARDNFLMQFQSDIMDARVIRPHSVETTAMGAAFLAGLATGFWRSLDEIREIWQEDRVFRPEMGADKRDILYNGWKDAVARCLYKPGD